MLGFSWAEIGVIMVVALLVIGPKDLPAAIRTVSAMIRKARGLAAEFQGHVNDLVREADLADVQNEFRNLRNFDLGGAVERHIDPEGDLRSAFDPTTYDVDEHSMAVIDGDGNVTETADEAVDMAGLPPFIPPEYAGRRPVPAFIPPGTRLYGS
jgi:sec-independent protein translocase protein TatB